VTMIAPLYSGVATAPSAPARQSDSGELREAAQAFEAIFLRQLLASARASSFGGEPLLGGPGLEQFEAMQDEQFAEIASQRGVFGLAEAIERQLSAFAAPVGA
jgi:peptidoglycan hydrolase FlgJ